MKVVFGHRAAPRAKRAVLHIGAPKTGTTSIQSFLAKNRGALRAEGALYPGSLGRPAHQAFAVAMGPLFHSDGLRMASGVGGALGLLRLRRDLKAALRREMAEARPDTLIISCENFFSGVRSHGHARRIRRFLMRFAETVEVVVYLRRQDRAIYSAWAHSLRIAKSAAFVAPTRMPPADRHDYAARLAIWADVFGRHAVRPVAFDAVDGDVVADFTARVGIRGAASDGARRNRSLDAVRAAFMAEINGSLPRFVRSRTNPARGDLSRAIDDAPDFGPPPPMAARDARAVLSLYAASNARLAWDWNGGVPFFDDEIGPDALSDQTFEATDAVQISAHLWARQQSRIVQLEAEVVALRRARLELAPPVRRGPRKRWRWPSQVKTGMQGDAGPAAPGAPRRHPSAGS